MGQRCPAVQWELVVSTLPLFPPKERLKIKKVQCLDMWQPGWNVPNICGKSFLPEIFKDAASNKKICIGRGN